jgi:hypothetical protein
MAFPLVSLICKDCGFVASATSVIAAYDGLFLHKDAVHR